MTEHAEEDPIMNLEITVTRGDINFVHYNDELMRALEGPLEAGKGATFTAWQRFRSAHKTMMEAVEGLTESLDPFTLTLRVEGKKKQVPPPGTWQLYSAGTTSVADTKPPRGLCSDLTDVEQKVPQPELKASNTSGQGENEPGQAEQGSQA